MTQGIRKFLDLPDMEEVLKEKGLFPDMEVDSDQDEDLDEIKNHAEMLKTIEMAQVATDRLNMIEGKDHADAMDKVYDETLKHAQDLMDLGFNIDIPRARGIFEVATTMYGQAISAKNSKRDAQLKAMKLALDQRKLDLEEKKMKALLGETEKNTIVGEATVIKEDRNELIKRIREQQKKSP